jgi:hypothetical protein
VTEERTGARPPAGLRALLADAIDYAGLFPPAQLDMPGAVAEYAAYLESNDSWALGRFVLPVSRLEELARSAQELPAAVEPFSLGVPAMPWPLSALVGADVAGNMERIRAFNAMYATANDQWRAQVHAVEVRATTPDAITQTVRTVGDTFDCFVEIPIATDPHPLVRALAAAGGRAKVRTGGTTPDAFPTSAQLARFLAACVAERVPFKATAGLHHPLRGEYRLTYDAGSASGTMYGFLNVLLAAALLRDGGSEGLACELLEERSPEVFQFDTAGVTWRGRQFQTGRLAASRQLGMISFGSCSFREPLDDLASLGLL